MNGDILHPNVGNTLMPPVWGKIFGTVIGAALGLLVDAPLWLAALTALGGALIGHLFGDQPIDQPRSVRPATVDELLGGSQSAAQREPRQALEPLRNQEQLVLAEMLCPIFIEIARCDGPVVQAEVRVVREFFQFDLRFDDASMLAVRGALKRALADTPVDLEVLVLKARPVVKPSLRLEVVNALYEMGLADAELTKRERDELRRTVHLFNLSDEQLQLITRRYFGAAERHLQTLGLSPDATDDDIKTSFRRLAAEHHPDRVASLGPHAAEQATLRFREVKEAYEELRKIKGF